MSNKIIANAIAAAIAMGLGTSTAIAETQPAPSTSHEPKMMRIDVPGMEQCYGVAKAGRNDCGTLMHACSGEAKTTGDKMEWLLVPKGLCDKIAGGSTTVPKKS